MAVNKIPSKAQPEKDQPEKAPVDSWGVKDSNAKAEPRIHEPIPGVRYSLTCDDFTKMPEAHARKFLCDPSFIVIDDVGEQVDPLNDAQKLRAGDVLPVLADDQTVANFEELTIAALLARAAQRFGGEKFNSKSNRADVILFLVGSEEKRKERTTRAEQDRQADVVDEASADEAADILAGA